jgi:hypothetical protein
MWFLTIQLLMTSYSFAYPVSTDRLVTLTVATQDITVVQSVATFGHRTQGTLACHAMVTTVSTVATALGGLVKSRKLLLLYRIRFKHAGRFRFWLNSRTSSILFFRKLPDFGTLARVARRHDNNTLYIANEIHRLAFLALIIVGQLALADRAWPCFIV